jgi:hypothetical protein
VGVTARTICHWESGRARIPYAPFKLLRVLLGGELPGEQWRGFFIRGERLYSPEDHGFTAADLSWLSLTFRRAEAFDSLYQQLAQTKGGDAHGGVRVLAAAHAANDEGRDRRTYPDEEQTHEGSLHEPESEGDSARSDRDTALACDFQVRPRTRVSMDPGTSA